MIHVREARLVSEVVHCDVHGEGRPAFVCRHLAKGTGLGFFHAGNGRYPDAWCSQCDVLMMQTGHWTEEAEKFVDITLVCHRCYREIRKRNEVE